MSAMTAEEMRPYFEFLSQANPDNDPHGMLEGVLCDAFGQFLDRTETPEDFFTKESWRELCEERDGANATVEELLRAEDAETFVFMMRDVCVYTAGCTGFVLTLFSVMLGEV